MSVVLIERIRVVTGAFKDIEGTVVETSRSGAAKVLLDEMPKEMVATGRASMFDGVGLWFCRDEFEVLERFGGK